jgi:hypothetical protein
MFFTSLKSLLVYLKGKSKSFERSSFTFFTAHHSGHLLHQLSRLLKLLYQAVYLRDLNACTLCDAVLAARI